MNVVRMRNVMLLALAVTIAACGGGGGVSNNLTSTVQGTIDPAYGSAPLSVLSSFADGPSTSNSNAFSLEVSSSTNQIVAATNGSGNLRALAVWIPGESGGISFSADCTAQALIFSAPRIYDRDPNRGLTLLSSIHSLSTFPALLATLQGNESQNLDVLLGTPAVISALKSCFNEWFATHPSNLAKPKTVIGEYSNLFDLITVAFNDSNQSATKNHVENTDFRILEVCEKDYASDGSTSVKKLESLSGGGAIILGNIFGSIGEPAKQDYVINFGPAGLTRSEIFFRGIGKLPGYAMPSDVAAQFGTSNTPLLKTMFWYGLVPILDSSGGFADFLNYSGAWAQILVDFAASAAVIDDLNVLNINISEGDSASAAKSAAKLTIDMFGVMVDDSDTLKNLLIDYFEKRGLTHAKAILKATAAIGVARLLFLGDVYLEGTQLYQIAKEWQTLSQINMASLKVEESGSTAYDVVDLGTGKVAEHINNNSVVLALSADTNDTYTWSNGTWTLAHANFKGVGINDAGVIVGVTAPQHPMILSGGILTPLPTNGNPGVYPTAINSTGDIAATIGFNNGNDQAGVYRSGALTQLEGTPGTPPNLGGGRALAINDSGQLAGEAGWKSPNNFVYRHAVNWNSGNVISDLATGQNIDSVAVSINNSGVSCGFVYTSTSAGLVPRAFMSSGSTMTMLDIPGVTTTGFSQAECINNNTHIVGEAQTSGGHSLLFLWTPLGVTDLQAAIPASGGWLLGQTLGINDKDEILVTATLNGVTHTLLLKPHS